MDSWNDKRNRLAKLIKNCSDSNGGDDRDWLKSYALELIRTWKDNLDEPIAAFESVMAVNSVKFNQDTRSN